MAPRINDPTASSLARERKSLAAADNSRSRGGSASTPQASPRRTRASARKKKAASAASTGVSPRSPLPVVGEADTLGSVDTGPGAQPLTLPPVAPFPPEEARPTATAPTSTRTEGHDDGKRVIRDAPFSVDPLPNLELTALPSSGLFSDRPPKLPPLAAASSSKVTRKPPIPDVNSMRDFRVVAREIAREEIKLDRDIHPQQSYEDMRASLISEIVPIVSRHMETRVVDGVYEKLRAAFQAELPLFVRDVVLDMHASQPPQSP